MAVSKSGHLLFFTPLGVFSPSELCIRHSHSSSVNLCMRRMAKDVFVVLLCIIFYSPGAPKKVLHTVHAFQYHIHPPSSPVPVLF